MRTGTTEGEGTFFYGVGKEFESKGLNIQLDIEKYEKSGNLKIFEDFCLTMIEQTWSISCRIERRVSDHMSEMLSTCDE
jgi:hypothetical protein